MEAYFSFLKNKKIIVDGGCGFIGSHLVKQLLNIGAKIFIIDNCIYPCNLLDDKSNMEFFQVDITDPSSLANIFLKIEPDYVFHLAAYGVNSKNQDIFAATNINVHGIINVIEAMDKSGCSRIVNIGSSSEYGNYSHNIDETTLLQPKSIYGSTKAAATLIAHQVAERKGIDIITLRPFGVFGEGEPSHKLFCYAILTLLNDNDLELTSCTQKRDYCYVENIVQAMLGCMATTNIRNEIYNIGTGVVNPLKYYIEKIYDIIQPNCEIKYGRIEHRKNEIWTPCPEIKKIQQDLLWVPKYSLEEGLVKTINWFRLNKQKYEMR